MAEGDRPSIKVLNSLYTICKAGERGFAVAAESVSNRGLKLLLKSYAQQRADFGAEVADEIRRLGGKQPESESLPAAIHRGRIRIRAALTIGAQNVENTVLNEALIGENAAVRTYERALEKTLPAESRAIVERQAKGVVAARNHLRDLRGHGGERLVVRLFDTPEDAQTAVQELEKAGFSADNVEIETVGEAARVYEGQAVPLWEVVLSGAVGGAIWGSLLGAAAGLGLLLLPAVGMLDIGPNVELAWGTVVLGGLAAGALFGMILGFLIGKGVSEEDVYLYDDSVRYGSHLLELRTDSERAPEAAKICFEVNSAARARTGQEKARSVPTAEQVGPR
jgi:uncharacterized protein (TIGR02284 family)